MRVLPAPLALRVLLAGIMRHTWTFAGTAHVSIARDRGRPPRLVMVHSPMCRDVHAAAPACHYYAATLECLLQRLVSPRARVVEERCAAMGAGGCEFSLRVAG